jgi:hypothetical protein
MDRPIRPASQIRTADDRTDTARATERKLMQLCCSTTPSGSTQTKDHCRLRRCYQRCGARRPLKDVRSRRLISLFGPDGPRSPVHSIPMRGNLASHAEARSPRSMPDRCTLEYEPVVAKMGAELPYCRARTLPSVFCLSIPFADCRTMRQRTLPHRSRCCPRPRRCFLQWTPQ